MDLVELFDNDDLTLQALDIGGYCEHCGAGAVYGRDVEAIVMDIKRNGGNGDWLKRRRCYECGRLYY